MMNHKLKSFKLFISSVICILIVCSSFSASAMTQFSSHSDVPYDTYTYWQTDGSFRAVYTKPLFDEADVITAHSLGIEDFTELVDISVCEDGYIYILDASSRIIVLTPEYKLYKEITSVGDKKFKGAKGIFAAEDSVYVSDTENMRVLITDSDGNYKGELAEPNSPAVPDDFSYKPIKTAVDGNGYKYILCDGSYYGALLYSPENEFLSFYGANTVKNGIAEFFGDLWEKLTMTDEKYEKQVRKFPYQFTDLCIDKNGFVYTSTGRTEGSEWVQKGVVRMLAPNGNDIIESSDVVFGEKEIPLTYGRGFYIQAQNMSGVAVDGDDFFYTFDTTYNKIYMYDSECNNVCVFGGGFDDGKQKGTFKKINAIDCNGDDIIAIDGIKNTITLFRCNEYGKTLKELQVKTLKGEYSETKIGWENVLRSDINNQFAYKGLAKAAYAQGNYKEALSLSKQAYDKEIYSQSYEQLRKEWLHHNITVILITVLAVIVITVILVKKSKRNKTVKNPKLNVLLNSAFHPVDSFTAIKQKNMSSVKLGIVILVLYYISAVTQTVFGSFMFVTKDAGSFNSVLLLLRTVGIVLLWSIANWAICSLFGGIGKMKEIFTVVCYSLVPMVVVNFAYTILTYVFIPDEVAFLSTIMTAITIYSLIMITIGTIIIHDFSFGKFVGTSLLTIFAMAVILFIIVLIIVLVQQFIAFGVTVYNEIIFR